MALPAPRALAGAADREPWVLRAGQSTGRWNFDCHHTWNLRCGPRHWPQPDRGRKRSLVRRGCSVLPWLSGVVQICGLPRADAGGSAGQRSADVEHPAPGGHLVLHLPDAGLSTGCPARHGPARTPSGALCAVRQLLPAAGGGADRAHRGPAPSAQTGPAHAGPAGGGPASARLCQKASAGRRHGPVRGPHLCLARAGDRPRNASGNTSVCGTNLF